MARFRLCFHPIDDLLERLQRQRVNLAQMTPKERYDRLQWERFLAMMEFARQDPVRTTMALLRSGVMDRLLDAKRIDENAARTNISYALITEINEKLTEERLRTMEADVDDDARAQDRFMEIFDLKFYVFEGLQNAAAFADPYFRAVVVEKFLGGVVTKYEKDYWNALVANPNETIRKDPDGAWHFIQELVMRNKAEHSNDSDAVLNVLRDRIGPLLASAEPLPMHPGLDIPYLRNPEAPEENVTGLELDTAYLEGLGLLSDIPRLIPGQRILQNRDKFTLRFPIS